MKKRLIVRGFIILIVVVICVFVGLYFTQFRSVGKVGQENKSVLSNSPLISVEEAQKLVENLCRRPDIGVDVYYNSKHDIIKNGVKYYYFDVIYGAFMGDKSKVGDDALSYTFVNSKDKSIYKAIVKNGEEITFKLGEKVR